MTDYQGLMAETVRFQGHDGDQVSGFLARPLGGGPYPGIIVIHEVFGLVNFIKEITMGIALHDYAILAPDLHHREGPGDPKDVAATVRAAGGNPDARTVGDIEGAAGLLRSLPYSSGKVGVMGFGSGGRQAYLAACSIPSLDAAVSCYGGHVVAGADDLNDRQPKAPIDMTEGLNCPLLGLFGEEDASPSPAQVAQTEQELKRLGKTYEFHTYENAGHGFFADYRPSYRVHAANDGWDRVSEWFGRHLA